jgi:hypothetical protein
MKMKSMMKPVFSLIIASAVVLPSAIVAEPAKCSPCQAAKSARDAIKKSIEEAAAAALAAGGAYSRDQELDMDSDSAKSCKPCQKTCRDVVAEEVDESDAAKSCKPCQKTCRDVVSEEIDENDAAKGCKPCQKTCRDVVAEEVDENDPAKCKPCQSRTNRDAIMDVLDTTQTVAACCEFCAQPGSLGCQGENSARCNTCQQGLIKMSLAEVAAAVALAQAVIDKESELDAIPMGETTRAPREELADPCNNCPSAPCDTNAISCQIAEQLRMVRCCCASVAHRLEAHAKQSKKCCRSLKHEIDEVEDMLTSVTDQTAASASLTEVLLLSIIDLLTPAP